MYAAIIENNTVINIVVADYNDIPGAVDGSGLAIGDIWDGDKFTRPEYPEEPMMEIVPESITRAQGKSALINAGLWSDVLDFVESLSGNEKLLAEVALNDTQEWRRFSPFLIQMANQLGLSDAQLDELFIAGSKIEL